MKLARYVGQGQIAIVEEPKPECPSGGLLVRTEASGLCSGELMDWYMDRKIPHVLGHEVSGIIEQSQHPDFPVGQRVFVHHHAPCLECAMCRAGHPVHCPTWKATKLIPGGMAEWFGVPAENLSDAFLTPELRPQDAALIEPLGCVAKSLRRARWNPSSGEALAIIGLGTLGILHALAANREATGYELSSHRREFAASVGIRCGDVTQPAPADVVVVCPGSHSAFELAQDLAKPGARIVMFAPLPPAEPLKLDAAKLYFQDWKLIASYSCGPEDTRQAASWLREGRIKAEQAVSHFIGLDDLPEHYDLMKSGAIVKPMVLFPA